MARTAAAVALATVPERVSVLETKVDNIEEKLDDIKIDVKDMHDCLDRTRDGIMEQLAVMNKNSCDQHAELAGKITDLEKIKNKYTMYAMIGLAFVAGAGWSGHLNLPIILKFLGL
jgi:hypothetical protein